MIIFNFKSIISIVFVFFCVVMHAMKPTTIGKIPGHDKFITQVRIEGAELPGFQRIYIMPYKGGPLRGIQEVAGITLNGIQDYAVTLKQQGKLKQNYPIIYRLEKPLLINMTTHDFELTVMLEMLDGSCKLWTFNDSADFFSKHRMSFEEMIGEFNELRINLKATNVAQQAVFMKISK